jgi:DNA-binding FadR family transcriptional regulator
MREILEGTAAPLAATRATAIEIEVVSDVVERDRKHADDPVLPEIN